MGWGGDFCEESLVFWVFLEVIFLMGGGVFLWEFFFCFGGSEVRECIMEIRGGGNRKDWFGFVVFRCRMWGSLFCGYWGGSEWESKRGLG